MFARGSADLKSPIVINDSIGDAVDFNMESSSPLLPEMYSPDTSPARNDGGVIDCVEEVRSGCDEATQENPLPDVVQVSREWYQVTEKICGMLNDISDSQLRSIHGINGAQLAELLNEKRNLRGVTSHAPICAKSKPQFHFEDSMDSMAFLLDSESRLDDFEDQPNHLSFQMPTTTTTFAPIQTSTQAPANFRQIPTLSTSVKAHLDVPATTSAKVQNADVINLESIEVENMSPNLLQSNPPKIFKPFQPPVLDRTTSFNPPLAPSTTRGGDTGPTVPTTCDSPQTIPTEDDELEFRGRYQHSQVMKMEFARTFGLKSFRLKQEEAINAVMLGHDAFILMPTGGGKSLCYQIPAILSGGVTVVISPLRSLILDQVQRLNVLQVPAAHLSGDQSAVEEQAVYFQLSKQNPLYKLVYLTPEKLTASRKLKTVLTSLFSRGVLDRVVIDEAHCISQWGHDFRPDYKRLSELKDNFRGIQILALTATATKRVRFDVARLLKLNNTKWFVGSCNRPNLKYDIRKKKPSAVNGEISSLIKSEFRSASGIVYCLSRKDCEVVCQALLKDGITAAAYHAGMSDSDRTDVQKKWLSQRYNVICATIAFGMGIDKPDVRFVIHHSMPKSLEGYYQESGRAGRDGQESSCILFYSYTDAVRMKSIIIKDSNANNNNPRIHMDNIHMMVQFCENITDCRRVQILNYLGEEFSSEECGDTCDNCRNLSQSEVVEKDMTQESQSIILSITMLSHVNFTLIQISDIFRGCQGQKIIQSNFNTLPMYGKSRGLNRTDVDRFLHLLIVRGVLVEEAQIGQHDNVFNYIRIGAEAEKVLKESMKIVFHCTPSSVLTTKFRQRNSANGEDSDSEHAEQSAIHPNFQECLDQLKLLRQQVSEEEDISPENIFNMATLREMSYSLPDTYSAFLAVTGVTQAKWKKFKGEAFLKITTKYCQLKREFLSRQADTLKSHSNTDSLPVRRHPGLFMKKKSKYFKKGSSQNNKFVKNFNGKSSKAVASNLSRAGVKTVNYTRASSTKILAPPVPRGRKIA